MNKYQRAKSKRIKKLQREMRYITYTEAKRLDRKIMRSAKRLADAVSDVSRGVRRFSRDTSEVVESLVRLRNTLGDGHHVQCEPKRTFRRTNYVFLDESTPFEQTPELWPKENPYLKKEKSDV